MKLHHLFAAVALTAAPALADEAPQQAPVTTQQATQQATQNATEQMLMEQLRARRDLQAQVLLLTEENAKLKSEAEKLKPKDAHPK